MVEYWMPSLHVLVLHIWHEQAMGRARVSPCLTTTKLNALSLMHRCHTKKRPQLRLLLPWKS